MSLKLFAAFPGKKPALKNNLMIPLNIIFKVGSDRQISQSRRFICSMSELPCISINSQCQELFSADILYGWVLPTTSRYDMYPDTDATMRYVSRYTLILDNDHVLHRINLHIA